MVEFRNDNGLHAIICPHCKEPVSVPQLRLFERQQLVYVKCGSCDRGITKTQIDDAYREYHREHHGAKGGAE